MDKRAYWLWLQHAFPAGSSKPKSIYNRFNDLEEFYKSGVGLWSRMSFISKNDISLLMNYSLEQAEITIEYCEKMNQHVVTPECGEYPSLLWNIYDPPAALYVRGHLPDLDECLAVSIVGSRKTSDIVLETAKSIAYELSRSGITIISGGAIGVDTAAHRGAMEGSSPTVAVLGCGLDYPYLMENELLRRKIADRGGALVTEYPPNMGVQKGTFQARNRIISGLTRGVLIVSATKKSGTMITARRALEQDRDVFAVPGNPMLPTSEGPNSLIKDGAVPTTCGQDIIDFYGGQYKTNDFLQVSPSSSRHQVTFDDIETDDLPPVLKSLSENAGMIYRALNKNPAHISALAEKTELRPSQILTAVTELELVDVIESYSGQRYSLKQ